MSVQGKGDIVDYPQAKYDAMTIARWLVAWADAEDADISNLKLQKLLYYAQGHHLAAYGRPLFSESIQAWSHGPVVPNVYRAFKAFGSGNVATDDTFDWGTVDKSAAQFLIEIWDTYGIYGAWQLRNMTHAETPWKTSFERGVRGTAIPLQALADHFGRRTSS